MPAPEFVGLAAMMDGLATNVNKVWSVCLLVWRLSSHSLIHHSYGDVTIIGKGLQILTLCLTRGIRLRCSSPTTRDTHIHLLPSIQQWSCHNLFSDIGLSWPGFEHPSFHLRGNALTHCATAAVAWLVYKFETLDKQL